jgi:starch phosphorylase
VLTIGFARRFATYKRGSLMIKDRERLQNLLQHAEHPIQIVISGKAHPRDDGGKHIIQDLFNFAQDKKVRNRIVFLEDYDMQVARVLIQGVDVWLNNPRRPYEASGTSGMKVIPNGGLNCSVLDGWWDEGYEPGVGWAIGDRSESQDDGHQDWLDSRSLYSLLETEIAPLFYQRNEQGVPIGWCQMIKQSIAKLAPQFSTARMVRDYATEAYVPAMRNFTALHSDDQAEAKATIAWRDRIQAAWPTVRITNVTDDAGTQRTYGDRIHVTVTVDLGTLTAADVRVQAVVGKVGANRELLNPYSVDLEVTAQSGTSVTVAGHVHCDIAGHQGYTVRIVPYHPVILVPSELPLVIWE